MKKVTLSENALEVAKSRYFMDGEEWEDCAKRVARTVAAVEHNSAKHTEDFFDMIYHLNFMPGGRILRNSGRPRGSLFNCYHIPIGDSIKEIGQCMKDCLELWSEGGGVGINFSSLRPKGDRILGKGGESSGLVSFIEATNGVATCIESGGSRRAAAIAHVDIAHPEILDFIDAKLVHGKLSHFNISVAINNAFLDVLDADNTWEFRFKQQGYGNMPAKDIWEHIVYNMVDCAEPGILNWDNFTKNNSYYFAPVMGTNPCGETTLEPYGVCCLGSLVLPSFITGSVNTNWKKLDQTIYTAVRFLDNVIDANKYILTQNDVAAHNSRRIGLGVMGLAEYLFAKGLRYGSKESIDEIERLMRRIRDVAYEASIKLAEEKGAFPKFDQILYPKASFVKKLPARIRMDIKKFGIRNCTTMAIAPTGTISLVADCMSGIEPLFAKAYLRKDRISERIYVNPLYEKMLENNDEPPDWYVDALNDLNPVDHLEVQAAVQKYVDGSVSKTINLPTSATTEDLSKLLIEYIRDLKGVTVYRDGCRDEQILYPIDEQTVREYLNTKKVETHLDANDVKCTSGKCEL